MDFICAWAEYVEHAEPYNICARCCLAMCCTCKLQHALSSGHLLTHIQFLVADPLVQHHKLMCDGAAADGLPGHHPHAGPQKGLRQVHPR